MIKVADFGLSENIGAKEYFRQDDTSAVKLPLKWLPPESINDHIFSKKSDVVSNMNHWNTSGDKVSIENDAWLSSKFASKHPTCHGSCYLFRSYNKNNSELQTRVSILHNVLVYKLHKNIEASLLLGNVYNIIINMQSFWALLLGSELITQTLFSQFLHDLEDLTAQ